MDCVICDRRRGKRHCPAKNGIICAQCCGEKRVLEVDCPESCQYLQAGRKNEYNEYRRHLQSVVPKNYERNSRVLEKYPALVAHLESAIAGERLSSRYMTDKSVAEALDLVLSTYRTEHKGILYESRSNDLLTDALRRNLQSLVESYRKPEANQQQGIVNPGEARLPLSEAIACLEFIREMVGSFIEAVPAGGSYSELLARLVPREKPASGSGSSIIVP